MRLLFKHSAQIPTYLSKRTCHAKTQRTEINQGESTSY